MTHTKQSHEEFLQSLFLSACEHHQNGNVRKAKELYLQILASADNSLLRYNLGLIYLDEGDYKLAQESFEAADSLQENDTDTIFNLALCQKQSGQPDKAVETYKRLLKSEPLHTDTLYNIAGCFRELKDHVQAIKYYSEVLSIEPKHEPAINNIAYCHQVLGNKDAALRYYCLLLDINPHHEGAAHMVSSLKGGSVDHSPDGYVRDVFDNYSDHYEDSLVDKLEYSVPSQLRDLLDELTGLPDIFTEGIDLGCGTGLSGESFADKVSTLSGVDLSPKMIQAAETKGVYAHLHVGNIRDTLLESSTRFDFFLAADVLAYVGKLDDLFLAIDKSSETAAVICFSTETGEDKDFHLQSTGRFAHSPEYIRNLAGKTGWLLKRHRKSNLRKEAGKWVAGDLWIFTSSA